VYGVLVGIGPEGVTVMVVKAEDVKPRDAVVDAVEEGKSVSVPVPASAVGLLTASVGVQV
jgi:hypothetical protein